LSELTYDEFDCLFDSIDKLSLSKQSKPIYQSFTIRLDPEQIQDLLLLKQKMGNISYTDVFRACLRKEADFLRSFHNKANKASYQKK